MTSKLRELGHKIGKMQCKNPWVFIIVAAIITAATIPGMVILSHNVDSDLETMLPATTSERAVMADARDSFQGDAVYVVLQAEDANMDVLSSDNLKYIDTLSQRIHDIEHVRDVVSASTVIKEDAGGIIPFEQNKIDALAKKDPRVSSYVNADRNLAVITVTVDVGSSPDAGKQLIKDIDTAIESQEENNPGLSARVTGFTALNQATSRLMMGDMMGIMGISFLLMIVYLLVHFQFNVKKTAYSMLVVVLALIWGLGVTGYLGIKMDILTMVSGAMIMILGSSYGINSVYYFYDDYLVHYPPHEAIPKLLEFTIIGLSGSAFAEVGGFLALLTGIVPSMRMLGVILAIGIFFALVVSIMVLPAFFALLEKDGRKTTPSRMRGAHEA